MINTKINFNSIQTKINEIQTSDLSLQEIHPSRPSLLQRILNLENSQIPSQEISPKKLLEYVQELTSLLKTQVSQATHYARSISDQKIKSTVCAQVQSLGLLLKENLDNGGLTDLKEKYHLEPLAFQQLQDSFSEMTIAIHNALIRDNDRQEVWGTRFCPEEAFSDKHWENEMTTNPYPSLKQVSFFKYYCLYAFTLAWTQALSIILLRNWWNKITTTGPYKVPLYLGALPLSTPFINVLKSLKKEKIRAVLSVVEPFENHSKGWLSSPITPSQWKEAQISQLQIPIEDFNTGTIAEVEKGVEFIRWNVLNNRPVYVHCKAGRGRSTLILTAYLIKYENLSIKEAFTLIQSQRPHAGFNKSSSKMQTLREYEKRVRI